MREIEKAMRVSLGTMESAPYEQMIVAAANKEVDKMELVKKIHILIISIMIGFRWQRNK